MRFSLALLALAVGQSVAFQPQALQQRARLVIRASAGGSEETSRWESVESRSSLNNSGPGAPVNRYDISFTPLAPRATDYENKLAYYASTTEPLESRWDEIENMKSLRNSGPGAPPARYDIAFTPLPPKARDYERTVDLYAVDGLKESRWDDLENRRSLGNKGSGPPPGQYDYTFTPLPPRARDYEAKVALFAPGSTGVAKESRWEDIENRRSLGNTGSGAPPANYNINFTPLAPRAREHERIGGYDGSQTGVESRWDLVENRVSFGNSGPGALPGQYDVTFTPVPPRARDYEHVASYYAQETARIESRWDLVEKRTSFSNSGPGALPSQYGETFTPMPPRARDFERTIAHYTPQVMPKPEEKAAMPTPSLSTEVKEVAAM